MLDRQSVVPPPDLAVEVQITGSNRDESLRFGMVTADAVQRAEAAIADAVETKRQAERDRHAEERAFELGRLAVAFGTTVSDTCRCGERDCWRSGIPWDWQAGSPMRWFSVVRPGESHYREAGEWIVGVERSYVWAARRFRAGESGVEFRHIEGNAADVAGVIRDFHARAIAAERLAAEGPRAALAAAKLQYADWETWTGWPSASRCTPSEFAIAAYRAGHGRRTSDWYHVRTTESGGYGEYVAETLGAMVSLPVNEHAALTGECWRGRDPGHRTD